MGFRLTALPDYCRKHGLEPKIVDGFWTRGFDFPFKPFVSIDHHTAGARTGYMPSLRILIEGRSDLAGPLCNGGAPRAADGDNTVYLIASGKANHAGAGNWLGATGNSSTVGLERELVGDGSDLTPWRGEVAARWHAAVCECIGAEADHVARHAEFALPFGRKIDTAGVEGDDLRLAVHYKLHPAAPPPTIPPEDHMSKQCAVPHPGEPGRVDSFVIAPGGNLYHAVLGATPDSALTEPGFGENLGGVCKSVTGCWVNTGTIEKPKWQLVVQVHGQTNQLHFRVWTGTAWSGWLDHASAGLAN
jgi:hypothetical protein